MKIILILFFIVTKSFAGVGDIAGGNNRHFKQFIDNPRFIVDWPLVKHSKRIHLPLYELCIFDQDYFATKNKHRGKVLKLKREYSPLNCKVKNDPKCDDVHRYIDDYPQINVYLVPEEVDRSKYNNEDFIRDYFLVTVLLYQIPHCQSRH